MATKPIPFPTTPPPRIKCATPQPVYAGSIRVRDRQISFTHDGPEQASLAEMRRGACLDNRVPGATPQPARKSCTAARGGQINF